MKVLIDTNVILDVLIKREPHFKSSASFLKLCPTKVEGLIAASQTTDIFYILQREGKNAVDSKALIKKLTDKIKVIDVTAADVKNAIDSDMRDYEDALLAFGGKRHNVDYIVTRNKNDFRDAPVPAISPVEFLKQLLTT